MREMQLVIEGKNIYNDNIHSHIGVQTTKIIHYLEVTERCFGTKINVLYIQYFSKVPISRFLIILTDLTRHEYKLKTKLIFF